MRQMRLYDEDIGAYRSDDPDTSVEAAHSIQATRLEAKVRDAIRAQGDYGATNSELVELLGISWNTLSPRCAPLCRKGFIHDSGQRRPGPSGRTQIVWKTGRQPHGHEPVQRTGGSGAGEIDAEAEAG